MDRNYEILRPNGIKNNSGKIKGAVRKVINMVKLVLILAFILTLAGITTWIAFTEGGLYIGLGLTGVYLAFAAYWLFTRNKISNNQMSWEEVDDDLRFNPSFSNLDINIYHRHDD